jgi:hypothetical protein
MNKRYDESPRCSATGITTVSILALAVAMAISLAFDLQPADASAKGPVPGTTVASRT